MQSEVGARTQEAWAAFTVVPGAPGGGLRRSLGARAALNCREWSLRRALAGTLLVTEPREAAVCDDLGCCCPQERVCVCTCVCACVCLCA